MKKLYSISFVLIVFIFLSIPMIQHIKIGDKNLSNENRVLNQKPLLPNNIKELKSYTSNVDNYLSDQFGYRTLLISFANTIRYYIFNEATSKQLAIGKNDFIFLNSHSSDSPNSFIFQVCDIKPLSKEAQIRIPNALNGFINHFQNLGIKTFTAVIPTKPRIYPEYLPNHLDKLCFDKTETNLDSILKNHKKNIYYPLDKMRKWKSDFQVYLPKHFHWNGRLAYVIADDIIKNVFKLKPDFDVIPTSTEVVSDLNHHFEGLQLLENSLKYDYKEFNTTACKGKTCTENFEQIYKNGNSFFFTKPATSNRKLLIISDSFGAEIAEHFIRAFDEVTLVNTNNLTDSERIPFYKSILNTTQVTHLLYLIHDGGIVWRTIKIEKMLNL